MKWTVVYLNEAVRQEVWALPNDMRAGIVRNAERIEAVGLERVDMPHVRHVRGKLWEIRAIGRDGIARGIYVAVPKRRVVILRVFVKKTPATPNSEIKLALQRAKEIQDCQGRQYPLSSIPEEGSLAYRHETFCVQSLPQKQYTLLSR